MDTTEATTRDEVAALIGAFLRAVSFGAGARPGYDDLRDLFVPGGHVIRNVSGDPEITTVDGFIAPRLALVESGELTAFEEYEIAEVTEVFGNVAQRFSTYGKRGVSGGVPFEAVGMISTQFVRTPRGWRISAMAWDDERPGLTVPPRYLSRG